MCGIAGFTGSGGKRLLEGMLKTIIHRGPDDTGVWHGDGIALGIQRLSIIDLIGIGPTTHERHRRPIHHHL